MTRTIKKSKKKKSMIIHLELNEDHLKLIRMVRIADEKDECLEIPKEGYLTITSHLLDDVAMVLGLRDQVIKGTEEDADGGAYPDDVEKRMLDAYNYVKDNLFYIETLLHQMCMEGIKVGKYKAHDRDLIWEKEE